MHIIKKVFFIKFSNFRSTTFVLRIVRRASFVVQEQTLIKGSWLVISGIISTAKMLRTSTQSMLILERYQNSQSSDLVQGDNRDKCIRHSNLKDHLIQVSLSNLHNHHQEVLYQTE